MMRSGSAALPGVSPLISYTGTRECCSSTMRALASSIGMSAGRENILPRGVITTVRGGKPTAAITFGHSKDHRPDLKQLVWILTVAADGAVPLAYRLADGNTSDDPTHIPTWDGLVALLGRADFIY